MNTGTLILEISKRTGIPKEKVSLIVSNYCNDCRTVIHNNLAGQVYITNVGNLVIRYNLVLHQMGFILDMLENKLTTCFLQFAEHRTHFRIMFTERVDKFYAMATCIEESKLIKTNDYNIKSQGAIKRIDYELYNKHIERMATLLDKFPTTLKREKYSEIQKIIMLKMHKNGVLQYPRIKDCEVYPVPLCDKR